MLANITILIRVLRSTKILPCGAHQCHFGLYGGSVMEKKQPSRRRVQRLNVPVLPSEKITIKRHAAHRGLSVAAYLRDSGLLYQPKVILDHHAVGELVKVNADLVRLGGVLRMWLSNDERLGTLSKEQLGPMINGVLDEIVATHAELFKAVQKI